MPLYDIWSEGYLATGMEGIPAMESDKAGIQYGYKFKPIE